MLLCCEIKVYYNALIYIIVIILYTMVLWSYNRLCNIYYPPVYFCNQASRSNIFYYVILAPYRICTRITIGRFVRKGLVENFKTNSTDGEI